MRMSARKRTPVRRRTACHPTGSWRDRSLAVIRWLLTIFLVLVVFSATLPWLEKFGVGRLPGDLRFTLFGKTIFLPFASTILLSLVVFAVVRMVR